MKRSLVLFLCLVSLPFSVGCSSQTCKQHRDCEKGSFCSTQGRCEYECLVDEDCQDGATCSLRGRCISTTSTPNDAGENQPEGILQKEQQPSCDEGQQRDCYTGKSGTQGYGTCKSGKQTCQHGSWSLCFGQVLPNPEVCDKKDNNCDGQTDEGLKECSCSQNTDCPASTPNCQAGICIRFCKTNQECKASHVCKEGYCQPCTDGGARNKTEVCNGKDDDCDGQMDENLSQICGSDIGECKKGTQICKAGVWSVCKGEAKPKTEKCNNLDDNCDGKIDEALTRICGSSEVGACKKGTQLCQAGSWSSCQGNVEPSQEICDGKADEDCDGKVDEGCSCTNGSKRTCGASDVGECKKGTQTCNDGSWGTCIGIIEPQRETCDKKDNDCDGKVDEDIIGCGCKQDGECPAAKPKCQAGVCIKFCSDSSECLSDEFCHQGYCQVCSGGANINKQEVCNGRDDDCDGQTDEGISSRSCGSDTGACTKGTQTCQAGSWGACIGEIKPTNEVCNGKDDDCDGQTDEGLAGCEFQAKTAKKYQTIHARVAHSHGINCIAYSPDGKVIASASSDESIILWDAKTGQLQRTLKGHTGSIRVIAFSPDGKSIASASTDSSVRLWDVNTGKKLKSYKSNDNERFDTLAFSPDGKFVVFSRPHSRTSTIFEAEQNINLWDLKKNDITKILRQRGPEITSLTFSPDGNYLAAASADATIKLWRFPSGYVTKTLKGHSKGINDIKFSPNSKLLASAGEDIKVKIWSVSAGQEVHTLSGHLDKVTSVAWSPDGKTLVSGSRSGSLKSWDPSIGKLQSSTTINEDIVIRTVVFHPSGKEIAISSSEYYPALRNIKILDATTKKEKLVFSEYYHVPETLLAHPTKEELISVNGNVIKFWNPSTGKVSRSFQTSKKQIQEATISKNGNILAVSNDDKTIELWDVAKEKITHTFQGHTQTIETMTFHPDGTVLAAAGWGDRIYLWNTVTGKRLHTLIGHTDAIIAVAWSPDGSILASAGYDKAIRLWNPKTGNLLNTLTKQANIIRALAFSPDGTVLASAGRYGQINLWNPTTGRHLGKLQKSSDSIYTLAFHPKGNILAATGSGNKITLWDPKNHKEISTLLREKATVYSLVFSSSGSFLATENRNGTIELWK